MRRFAIYTAIVGSYDDIPQPATIDDRFDYILFSNDIPGHTTGRWQPRTIPYDNPDRTRVARWVKTHADTLLPEYEASVWIDGRIKIADPAFYDRIEELFLSNASIGCLIHPERDSIYDEIVEVMLLRLEREDICIRWGAFLTQEQYPEKDGLSETGVVFRNHRDSVVERIDRLWWDCIAGYSRRDQLSFNYVLWKLGVVPAVICDGDVRSSRWFDVGRHTASGTRHISHEETEATPLLSYFLRYPNKTKAARYYRKIYSKRHPQCWAWAFGHYLSGKKHLANIIGHIKRLRWKSMQ